jgi:hypothetical protein
MVLCWPELRATHFLHQECSSVFFALAFGGASRMNPITDEQTPT